MNRKPDTFSSFCILKTQFLSYHRSMPSWHQRTFLSWWQRGLFPFDHLWFPWCGQCSCLAMSATKELVFGALVLWLLAIFGKVPLFSTVETPRFAPSLSSIYGDFSVEPFRPFWGLSTKKLKSFDLFSKTAQIAVSIRSTVKLCLFCLKTSSIICLETFCSSRYTPKASSILDWKYNVLHFAR